LLILKELLAISQDQLVLAINTWTQTTSVQIAQMVNSQLMVEHAKTQEPVNNKTMSDQIIN
jgi:hypothetical protein